MHIILTHEQADFDAIASLLGAHILEEGSLPVLPRRINRNAAGFINLYGREFPFVDPRDLPKEKITTITLVDTQSLISIKGAHKHTQIYVIDHHPQKDNLPKEWSLLIEDTGAAVTLIVETLRERGMRLTSPQATLMLLGIYEDTGGLTYARTTARDMSAAAYLLEQGANLTVVNKFMKQPLSKKQQAVYAELKANLEAVESNNTLILLASADAKDFDEDLSSVVHKLRDELEPDALFVLAEISSGIQLVARATTDKVNVGQLAKSLGGGGHTRAAAALLKDHSLQQVKENLLKSLPDFIKPAKTVAEIMSRDPLLLTPDTNVRAVADLMQQYGFEGYPVVQTEQVIGLVTRRAVDRTLRHKLNLSVQEIMEAGNITIPVDASVEALQKLMIETGWGQIPVTNKPAGKIIGIVTRTDVLKMLAPQELELEGQSLSTKLEEKLPAARLALLKAVAQAAQTQTAALYVVGGFVRDLFLDHPSQDYDLVVEGDAIALGNALVHEYGGSLIIHKQFGTAKWQIAAIRETLAAQLASFASANLTAADFPDTLDLVSARKEFYTHPTALPTVERGSIKLDLHRRDFTINTLALRLDGSYYGQVYDYWGGKADIDKKIVRVLHSLSFVDDPTRILRAVRFEQRFGYQIGARTMQLLSSALPLLDRVSGDRIRHELNVILQEAHYAQMLGRLKDLQVLSAIHSALDWGETVRKRIEKGAQAALEDFWEVKLTHEAYPRDLVLRYLFWFMRLPSTIAASLMGRLRMPGWLTKIVIGACTLNEHLPRLKDARPSEVVQVLENIPRMALYAHYAAAEDEDIKHALHKFVTHWHSVKPTITGYHLKERDIPPSPYYRQVLITLRAAWLDGKISSKAQETKLLETLLKDETAN